MYIYDYRFQLRFKEEPAVSRREGRLYHCGPPGRAFSERLESGSPPLWGSEGRRRLSADISHPTGSWETGRLGSPSQAKFQVFSLPKASEKVATDKALLAELTKMKTNQARALARAISALGKPRQFAEALRAALEAVPLPGEGLNKYAIYLARLGAEAFILGYNVTGDKRFHVGFVDHPSRLYDSPSSSHREYFLHFAIRRLLADASLASTADAHARALVRGAALFFALQTELAREFRLIGIPENLLVVYRRLLAAIMWRHYQLQMDDLLARTRSLSLTFGAALKELDELLRKASVTLVHDADATLPLFRTDSGEYRDYFTPSNRSDIGFTHFSRFAGARAESELSISFRRVFRRRYEQKSLLEDLQRRSHPQLPPLLHDSASWQVWLRRLWENPLLQRDKLGDLLGLVHRYFEAFTVHVPHDLKEGCSEKNYLTRSFPRAATGGLIHDCAVYAIRWLNILGGLFTPGLTPYGIANPRAFLVEMPSHVGAMIRMEFVRPFLNRHVLISINNKDAIVHNDNLQESEQVAAGTVVMDRYKGLMTPYFLRPIKSRLSDGTALWKEVCRIFATKLRLPYSDSSEPHLRYLAYNAGIAGVSREVADSVGGLWLALQRTLARNQSGTMPSERLREEIDRYAQSVKAAVDAGTKKYKNEVEPLIEEIEKDLDANKHRIPKGARIVDSAQPSRQPWESAWHDYSQELEKSVKSLDLSQSNPERFFTEDDFVAAVE